jgi:uncharacterized protein (TIGR02646 family)
MIRVRRPPFAKSLTAAERKELGDKQAEANGYSRRDGQIKLTWKNFRRTNTGKAILAALQVAFHHKCAFCENVNARAIDHFYPKERYPKKMFRWTNFILCCSLCNLEKGNTFPFRKRRPTLIDPTREDPLEFFTWDLQTGAIAGVIDPDRGHRAETTRTQLKLDVGPLREARRVQFNRVLQLLTDVVNENPVRPDTRQRLQEELHPDRPYLGIIRFLFSLPNAFRPIVNEARAKLPEMDHWVAEWL